MLYLVIKFTRLIKSLCFNTAWPDRERQFQDQIRIQTGFGCLPAPLALRAQIQRRMRNSGPNLRR
jgi:hypothetical protein